MTQQNAALVEQSSAASESLKDQASRLLQVVAAFKTEAAAGA
jgi:methyl-accepting chemotaxis protein